MANHILLILDHHNPNHNPNHSPNHHKPNHHNPNHLIDQLPNLNGIESFPPYPRPPPPPLAPAPMDLNIRELNMMDFNDNCSWNEWFGGIHDRGDIDTLNGEIKENEVLKDGFITPYNSYRSNNVFSASYIAESISPINITDNEHELHDSYSFVVPMAPSRRKMESKISSPNKNDKT